MIILKILGAIDFVAGVAFLMLIFGIHPFLQFILFCSGLLLLKGFFVITGDVLSVIDIFSSITLLLSVFFSLPAMLLWAPAFLLLAKGFWSFI